MAMPASALDPEALRLKARLDALREEPAYRDHPLLAELEQLGRAHLKLLERMAKITRISDGFQVQLKELNEGLRRASGTDALTGIPNRRAMMEHLQAELPRAARAGTPFSVLMADVDRFKAVNDTHGHETGDRLLQALAKALAEGLRAYDTCARWGGEEFLVLLPGTPLEGALEVGEKLVRSGLSLSVPAGKGPLNASLSVGAAQWRAGEDLDSVLRRADAAMYEAKGLGGGRIIGR
jgi:diguanylate cyclase (GGDEF)-like protein